MTVLPDDTGHAGLCRVDDIPDPGARGPFLISLGGGQEKIFLIRRGQDVRAFVDRCPHAGVPLESEPDQFLDSWTGDILCSIHGARFSPESGHCFLGPCRGRSLYPVALTILNGIVFPAAPADSI